MRHRLVSNPLNFPVNFPAFEHVVSCQHSVVLVGWWRVGWGASGVGWDGACLCWWARRQGARMRLATRRMPLP